MLQKSSNETVRHRRDEGNNVCKNICRKTIQKGTFNILFVFCFFVFFEENKCQVKTIETKFFLNLNRILVLPSLYQQFKSLIWGPAFLPFVVHTFCLESCPAISIDSLKNSII